MPTHDRSPASVIGPSPSSTIAAVNVEQLQQLLGQVAAGKVAVEAAVERLRRLPFESLPFATVDHHRGIRCGQPEVIFCQGKTADQVVAIAQRLAERGAVVLGTRASDEQLQAIRSAALAVEIDSAAGAFLVNPPAAQSPDTARVLVISAGTADHRVAAEAMLTLRAMDVPARHLVDVGVAGLHRLLAHVELLQQACAIVVVAGMEGALPSVVGGLVACPVFAVPTSVGYGASFGGVAALLGMLNSCASGVSVVNIDNGFGGAFAAGLVYKQLARRPADVSATSSPG